MVYTITDPALSPIVVQPFTADPAICVLSSYTVTYSPIASLQTIAFTESDENGQMSFLIGHSDSLDVAETILPWQTDITVTITASYGPIS